MKHSPKAWLAATRYWSFPVSTMPVVVTFAYLASRHMLPQGILPYVCLALTLAGVVILHSAGNVLSDYFDYRTGVDNPEAFAIPNLVFKHFQPREYLAFSMVLFAAGCLTGLVLTWLTGWQLLVIGGLGVLLTAGYSYLKYNALGDLDVFLIFSVLIMLGTGFVLTGRLVPDVLVLALPVGVITVSVLHANNTVDTVTDGKAGMKSLPMLLGGRVSAALYRTYMVIPFVAVVVAVACGQLSAWALLCLPAAMPAARNFRAASHYQEKGIATLSGLDLGSAQLQLVFSGLLSAGLLVAAVM